MHLPRIWILPAAVLAILFSSNWQTVGAEEAASAPDELPAGAQRLIEASTDALSKLRQNYLAAVDKEHEKLVGALLKEQESQTKAGRLDAALAVRAQIKRIQNGELLELVNASDSDLLGNFSKRSKAAPKDIKEADLSATPRTVLAGAEIKLVWSLPADRANHPKDWIGLYADGVPNNAFDRQRYIYTQGQTNGTYTVIAPSAAGEYEFRYLTDDGFNSVAVSNKVVVTAAK